VTFWNSYWEFVIDDYDYRDGWWGWWGPRGHYEQRRRDLFVKTIDINSAAEVFDVNIKDDLKIYTQDSVNVHVKFTEASTRKVIETSAVLNIVQYAYEMVLTGSDILVPNQPYNFKVSLRRIGTGVPVS
jgi:hypothetical protein